ncbi:hypothetical protein WMY93_012475 [Mugilogobius chulae]|uniref:Uncharacterized protein n=1 Tax=Mugilogobius chulae TaxID=88201 RepID=A0AAW0P953_9GOBI
MELLLNLWRCLVFCLLVLIRGEAILLVLNAAGSSDLFAMIERMQGFRMDEQRCPPPPPLKTEEDYIPYPSVHEVLGRRSPFPLILLPQFGGYWIEGTNHEPKDPLRQSSPPVQPHTSNWRPTASPKSTGSSSWGRSTLTTTPWTPLWATGLFHEV